MVQLPVVFFSEQNNCLSKLMMIISCQKSWQWTILFAWSCGCDIIYQNVIAFFFLQRGETCSHLHWLQRQKYVFRLTRGKSARLTSGSLIHWWMESDADLWQHQVGCVQGFGLGGCQLRKLNQHEISSLSSARDTRASPGNDFALLWPFVTNDVMRRRRRKKWNFAFSILSKGLSFNLQIQRQIIMHGGNIGRCTSKLWPLHVLIQCFLNSSDRIAFLAWMHFPRRLGALFLNRNLQKPMWLTNENSVPSDPVCANSLQTIY